MAEHIDLINARNHARNNNSEKVTSPQSRNTNARPFDDVIASLANATENRRARQVSEWERMRRQIFRSAS